MVISGLTGARENRPLQMNRLSLRKNRLKLEASGGLRIILEESVEYASNEWSKPEVVNMQPVGFRITRILTDYAQDLPSTGLDVFLIRPQA